MTKSKILCIVFLSLSIVSCNSSTNQAIESNENHPPINHRYLSLANEYYVGPTKTYKSLKEVAKVLKAGDIVYVDGNSEYAGGIVFTQNGNKEAPIKIIGVVINGKRPIIKADNTNQILLRFDGNHYVLDNFEVIGNLSTVSNKNQMTSRGIYQVADDLTIKNCIVHDTRNGIMAADQFSGDLTIENSNIYANGYQDGDHNIYIASDRIRYPNSVTKIIGNYIHDSRKGAGLKTRTLRNEVYYNWFENNAQSEVDMFGADLGEGSDPIYDADQNMIGYKTDNHTTQDELRKIDQSYGENYLREDTDFVGNLVISSNKVKSLTIGGDGGSGGPTRNGTSFGRYRIVNNTFINSYNSPDNRTYIGQLKFGVGSVEFDNNIVYNQYGNNIVFYFNDYDSSNDIHHTNSDLRWSADKQLVGFNNWFKTGSKIPPEFQGSIIGSKPDFIDDAKQDFHLVKNSPLTNLGTNKTSYNFATPIYYSNINGNKQLDNKFRNPLLLPVYEPCDKLQVNFGECIHPIITHDLAIGAYYN